MSIEIPSLLREAHRLRRHIRELQSEIDLGPRVMKAQQARLAAEQQAHKESHDAIGKLKLKIREDEGTLKQNNTQLAKFEKQLDDAGSPKEYEAKQSEIRMAKERINAIEEQILSSMEELEARMSDLPNVDQKWADAQKEFEQYKIDAKERLERMQAEMKLAQAQLAELEPKIPATVRGQYDRLIKQYGADGLSGVDAKACQQCRMNITEQQKMELSSGQFVCCSNCGRGLYLI